MKAITFHGRRDVRYETVDDPRIEDAGDAVVRVWVAAICGSDLHPYHEREEGLDPGTVMGHEFVGEIVEAGPAVQGLEVGDVVMAPFTTNCGICFYCRRGLTCRCAEGRLFGWVEDGEGLQGAQAEYVRVPLAATTLMELPDGIRPEEGLLLGDILSTGFHCAERAEIEPGGTYAILGCGPVGLMTIIGAREAGAERLFAVDRVPARLDRARQLGATPLNFETEDPAALIREVTDGRGADAVMEAVGTPDAKRLAVDLLRPGGVLSAVGVHTDPDFGFTPVDAYDLNLTLCIGRCPARYWMERLVPLVQERKYDLASVFSHRLPLEQGARGYEIFDQKLEGCIKVLLEVS